MTIFKKTARFLSIAMVYILVTGICGQPLVAAAGNMNQKYAPVSDSFYDITSIRKSNQNFDFDKTTINELLSDAEDQPVYADKVGNQTIPNTMLKSSGATKATTTTTTKGFGTYPTRYGVILVTADAYKGIIPTGHAAIIWTSSTVVESLENGVTTGPNNWNSTKKTCYGVTTYGTTAAQDDQASYYAYAKIGKPYNWFYPDKWTRSSFYCSQLVYAAFYDLYGIDLDTCAFLSAIHPLELVDSCNTYTIYEK